MARVSISRFGNGGTIPPEGYVLPEVEITAKRLQRKKAVVPSEFTWSKNDGPTTVEYDRESPKHYIPNDQSTIDNRGTPIVGGTNGETSSLEDFAEIFDPTGILSWDDLARARERGDATVMDYLAVIPLLGKIGMLGKASALQNIGRARAMVSNGSRFGNEYLGVLKAAKKLGQGFVDYDKYIAPAVDTKELINGLQHRHGGSIKPMRKSIARYGNGGGVPTFQEYVSASMPSDVNFDALPDGMKKKIKDGYDFKYRSEMQPLESRSANVPDAPVATDVFPTISKEFVSPVIAKRKSVAAAVPAMAEKPVTATPAADDDTPTIEIDPNDKSTMVEGQGASPKLDANKRKPITQQVVEADNASKQAEGAKAATVKRLVNDKTNSVPGEQIGSKAAYYINKQNIVDIEKQKKDYDKVLA